MTDEQALTRHVSAGLALCDLDKRGALLAYVGFRMVLTGVFELGQLLF